MHGACIIYTPRKIGVPCARYGCALDTAGDRIRTGDVQLANPLIRAQVMLWQWVTMRFLSGNEVYKWLASDHPSGHLLTSRWRLTKFVTNSFTPADSTDGASIGAAGAQLFS